MPPRIRILHMGNGVLNWNRNLGSAQKPGVATPFLHCHYIAVGYNTVLSASCVATGHNTALSRMVYYHIPKSPGVFPFLAFSHKQVSLDPRARRRLRCRTAIDLLFERPHYLGRSPMTKRARESESESPSPDTDHRHYESGQWDRSFQCNIV